MLSALILGAAVCVAHYTGMAAASYTYNKDQTAGNDDLASDGRQERIYYMQGVLTQRSTLK
jgi:NO-binding membrane sensor protein with MHYT domain